MSSLQQVVQKIKNDMHNNQDVIVRNITCKSKSLAVIYIDEIVDVEQLNLNIIGALNSHITKIKKLSIDNTSSILTNIAQVEVITEYNDALTKLLQGSALVIIDNYKEYLALNITKYQSRAITEPPTSVVIKGPREGFNENIKTNISLIRKRLVTDDLVIEDFNIGRRTQTAVKIAYLNSLTDESVVKKLKNKLKNIDIDGIIDSYYISKLLEDRPSSIFRQVGSAEKPDIICAKMLEGRVAIFVDGSPIVLTVPYVLIEDLQNSNDYYSEAHRVTTLRIVRLMSIFASVFIPGFYIALQLYHYKVMPLKFLVTIVNSTQNLPLSPFLEIFFIIILFEILFEASIRMPKYLGIAISIVGALILGDTAVKAGLVSPPGVMIIAISGITLYTIPDQHAQLSTLRLAYTFIGGVVGFQGILLATIILIVYLTNFDSYGAPYFAPLSPYIKQDQKDFVIKVPLERMTTRPKSFPNKNRRRINQWRNK